MTVAALAVVLLRSVGPSMGFSLVGRHHVSTTLALRPYNSAPLRASDEQETPTSVATSSTGLPQKVQVCGFKDCRRVGGGKKLEAMVHQVLKDNEEVCGKESASAMVDVEVCDCLGECGYGPNMLVDGRIVNGVRGRQAVLQALGLASASASGSTSTTGSEPATQVPSQPVEQQAPSRAQG